ncbi:hypothetical protein HanRHA438_Chr09g0411351 [Helianthus annuus]|nr:hypothetical protein HanIR_Chr09g0430431 [Helianthus annuus]KAJ0889293.1 hypothetical protein HanRHA438_Chr09g0411351 [Helianthus annuus]
MHTVVSRFDKTTSDEEKMQPLNPTPTTGQSTTTPTTGSITTPTAEDVQAPSKKVVGEDDRREADRSWGRDGVINLLDGGGAYGGDGARAVAVLTTVVVVAVMVVSSLRTHVQTSWVFGIPSQNDLLSYMELKVLFEKEKLSQTILRS